jgi:signal peptide peptidase SppA
MKILDVLNAPWAIQPTKLLEIQGIYATHLRGEKIDLKVVEAAIGRPLNNQSNGYEVIDGVAVLPITGVISKRMNLFAQISGGVSTELVARDLKAAIADPAVKAIILQIDSPGGTVDGTETLANLVREAKAVKPTVAFADGMMASAAYWIGSAASEIYISDSVAQIGSIGVVATHQDISAAEAARGVKTTEITAGKFKRAASQFAPLTESGRQTIQDQVDSIYSVFVQAVADNRGVSVDTVLQDMADGRVFIGQQAIDAGLVDGVSTLDALIAKLSRQGAGAMVTARKPAAIKQPAVAAESLTDMENQPMKITMQDVLAHAPDVAEALRAEGAAAAQAAATEQGATAERARIQAVFEQSIPGHEALINSLAFDGKTSGAEAAVAVLGAEKALRTKALGDRRADAPAAVPHAAAPVGAAPATNKDAPIEERAKAAWDGDAKLRADFGNFDTYLAYAKAEDAGKVKVLSSTK